MTRFRAGWPAQTRSNIKFYTTESVQYRYLEAGEGQTIIFTADPPMTLEVYDQLVEIFAKHFRVIVVPFVPPISSRAFALYKAAERRLSRAGKRVAIPKAFLRAPSSGK